MRMAPESNSFGSCALAAAMDQFLLEQASYARTLGLAEASTELRRERLRPLLVTVAETANGMSLLGRHGLLNETCILARALLERCPVRLQLREYPGNASMVPSSWTLSG